MDPRHENVYTCMQKKYEGKVLEYAVEHSLVKLLKFSLTKYVDLCDEKTITSLLRIACKQNKLDAFKIITKKVFSSPKNLHNWSMFSSNDDIESGHVMETKTLNDLVLDAKDSNFPIIRTAAQYSSHIFVFILKQSNF